MSFFGNLIDSLLGGVGLVSRRAVEKEVDKAMYELRYNMELIEEQYARLDIAKKDSIAMREKLRIYEGVDGAPVAREITFEPHQKQAGIQILSYFQEVVDTKYKNKNVRVSIRQEGSKVIMIIISPDDNTKEEVEKTFEEYASVVVGDKSVDSFLDDKLEILALQSKLDIVNAELRNMERILDLKDESIRFFKNVIEQSVSTQPQIHIMGGNSYSFANSVIDNEVNVEVNISQEVKILLDDIAEEIKGINETEDLPESLKKLVSSIQDDVSDLKNSKSDADVVEDKKFKRIQKFVFDAIDENSSINKTLDGLLSGLKSVQNLAEKYNNIADIFLLPKVPSVFLK